MAKLPIPFGNPYTYPGHSGVDFPQPRGTVFRASGPGVVGRRTSNARGGNMVWIDYDGYAPHGVAYAHLDNYQDSPPVGTRVREGDIIGRVGNSGNTTGPHLHVEVYGKATTDGFWSMFDPNRVVGAGGGAGGAVGPTQRVAGPSGAKVRQAPTTAAAEVDFLTPGAVGTFNGWIRGLAVEGNDVWFRGAYSGGFSWSGGFTSQSVANLEDLNPPPPIAGNQRQVADGGANGRVEPNTNGAVMATLPPGSIHTFTGWIKGQAVEGNDIWFRGSSPLYFYWSGGFTNKGTAGLTDLNPPPVVEPTRVVAAVANVRAVPWTTSPALQQEQVGAVVKVKAYTRSESVSGNDMWYQRAIDGLWMWSGGFTSQSTDGLPAVTAPPKPQPTNPNNPRNLPSYQPVYPAAVIGLDAPLGFTDCKAPIVRAPRTQKGMPPVPTSGVIDRFIIHYTSVTSDQLDYFSYCNDRQVCPSYYLRGDAGMYEMIRPGAKPAATGPEWNWRSIAVETQALTPGPEGKVSEAQLEALSQMIAWLAEFDGKMLDGAPVSFKIDRTHVISHQEALPGTECPGTYIQSRMDQIVARAQAIWDEKHPLPPKDYVAVLREDLERWTEKMVDVGSEMDEYLKDG